MKFKMQTITQKSTLSFSFFNTMMTIPKERKIPIFCNVYTQIPAQCMGKHLFQLKEDMI